MSGGCIAVTHERIPGANAAECGTRRDRTREKHIGLLERNLEYNEAVRVFAKRCFDVSCNLSCRATSLRQHLRPLRRRYSEWLSRMRVRRQWRGRRRSSLLPQRPLLAVPLRIPGGSRSTRRKPPQGSGFEPCTSGPTRSGLHFSSCYTVPRPTSSEDPKLDNT
jgi:hypothetical protein